MTPDVLAAAVDPPVSTLSDAIDFATTLYTHNSDRASAYRDERITTLMAVLTAMFASLGFWVSLSRRRHLFKVYAAAIVGAAAFALMFQFFWYRYAYTYWAVGEEYRKEATKLITDPGRHPFSPGECNGKPVAWELRKDRKVLQKWYREEIDECREMVWGNLSVRQLNFWPALIVLAASGVIVLSWRTRRGPDDVDPFGASGKAVGELEHEPDKHGRD